MCRILFSVGKLIKKIIRLANYFAALGLKLNAQSLISVFYWGKLRFLSKHVCYAWFSAYVATFKALEPRLLRINVSIHFQRLRKVGNTIS